MTCHRIACWLAGLVVCSSPALADPGLVARYGDGGRSVMTVVISPSFSLRENESVYPQIGVRFTADYSGSLKILRRGRYTFQCQGKLSIDGKEVNGAVDLEPGEHELAIHYQRKDGPARLQPMWSSDQFIAEPIPASVLSHRKTPGEVEAQSEVERGRMVVEEHNCAGCHKGGARGLVSRIGPDLSNIGARANAFWIFKWLENPRHFRGAAAMPAILSKAEDRRDAAAYLATLKDNRRRAEQYRHSAEKEKEGQKLFSSIGCANCHGATGMSLDGMGSKATIGGLAMYLENPTSFDRSGRMPAMQLSREEAVALADFLTQSKSADFTGALPEGADARHGGQLVRTAGCLNCHTIDGQAGKPLAEATKFAALDQLDPAKGCLSENPPEGAARYDLSAEDRKAAAAFLAAIKTMPLISSAPAHEFHRMLQKMNCGACHDTDQTVHTSEDAEKLPPLVNLGAKLKRDWIGRVLNDKRARVRFWLKTRMPEFGGAVSNMPAQAVAAAGVDENEPSVTPDREMITLGRELVGANDPKSNPTGMGCVTCHSLREFKPAVAADATRGPELTLMYTRLRADFFKRWLHEPSRIQAGTAMPNFFTDQSPEEFQRVTNILWNYASLGEAMPAPRGIKEKKSDILIVTDAPIVQRCQVPDPAGTIVYGISVGLPQMINYTFDADRVLLRQAWSGSFLDMSGDWHDRGGNPVRIMGRRFYEQAAAPIHFGSPDADEPRVFKGYELKDKIPTFIYTVGGVEVRERITAPETGVGLVRSFEIDGAAKPVYFTAADDPDVTLSASSGEFKPAQVKKSFKSNDKTAGQAIEFPAGGKTSFSVTIRPKNAK